MMQAFDQRFGFDALLINLENLAVIESLWTDPKWILVYADSHRLLYFRRASYSGPGFALENLKLYNGENLRHWAYAFGMYSWAGLALRFNDMNLAAKVMSETEKSPYVPSTSIRYFLGLAVRNHSLPLADRALALMPKMYESNYGDISKIDELQAQIRR